MIKIKNKKDRYKKKNLRKMLGHWNLALLIQQMVNKSEMNRVHLKFVPAEYSSQTCSECDHISHESRQSENWEIFSCIKCGYTADADFNGSKIIKSRGEKYRQSTVACEQKRAKDECLSLSIFA